VQHSASTIPFARLILQLFSPALFESARDFDGLFCLFVCLFVCLFFVCLFVCLFVVLQEDYNLGSYVDETGDETDDDDDELLNDDHSITESMYAHPCSFYAPQSPS
jgi:hypothetical protein